MTNESASRMKCLALAAALLGAAGRAGAQGPAMSALPADACRDFASVGYNCCLFVTGDGIQCRATHLTRGQDSSRAAVQRIVSEILRQVATGGTTLARFTAGGLIPSLVTDRLDLTGQDRLASGAVARCVAGERVTGRSNRTERLYTAGEVSGLRAACQRQNVERALEEARRPQPRGARCGTLITTRPTMELTGRMSGGGSYVRPERYCQASAPNCCQDNSYLITTSNAYCERDPLPNDGRQRYCARSVAP